MRILVLGAGKQGGACAYDLVCNPAVEQVILADRIIGELPPYLTSVDKERLRFVEVDAGDHNAVLDLMRQCDAVACALPYYLNLDMTRLAVQAGKHFCDLGGNTDIVLQQKELHAKAAAAGVSIIPDCGLAPGMVNIVAMDLIGKLKEVSGVRMYVGGLPIHPEPPLNYQIVYSVEGMLDYYTTPSRVLRAGQLQEVDPLSEVEELSFSSFDSRHLSAGEQEALMNEPETDPPTPILLDLEAFHTAGGLSTMGARFEGKYDFMEYKTLRYRGHATIMRAIRDLGLLSSTPLSVKGVSVVPRDVFIAVAEPTLLRPESRDMVVMRVKAWGKNDAGKSGTLTADIFDFHDVETGITAMMRCTGYSLAITATMQVSGAVEMKGVHTPDECVNPARFISEWVDRRLRIVTRWQPD